MNVYSSISKITQYLGVKNQNQQEEQHETSNEVASLTISDPSLPEPGIPAVEGVSSTLKSTDSKSSPIVNSSSSASTTTPPAPPPPKPQKPRGTSMATVSTAAKSSQSNDQEITKQQQQQQQQQSDVIQKEDLKEIHVTKEEHETSLKTSIVKQEQQKEGKEEEEESLNSKGKEDEIKKIVGGAQYSNSEGGEEETTTVDANVSDVMPPPIASPADSSSSTPSNTTTHQSNNPIIRQGCLVKMNRDGDGVNMLFKLTADSLTYTESTTTTSTPVMVGVIDFKPLQKPLIRTLPCDSIVATPAPPPNVDSSSFCILSKSKSFLVQGESPESVDAWIASINDASHAAQRRKNDNINANTNANANANTNVTFLKEEDCMPILDSKRVTSTCPICTKTFGFFDRRHHCRNCGKCVCDSCSREKVRIVRLDPRALFKVCNPCANHIKDNRQYGVNAYMSQSSSQIQSSSHTQSETSKTSETEPPPNSES